MLRRVIFACISAVMIGFSLPSQAASGAVDFQRQIRPILSQNCFLCHGPDEAERKGGLRLDIREDALKPSKSGARAIVPKQPDQSELLKRIAHTDPDEVMPPSKSGKKLSEEEEFTPSSNCPSVVLLPLGAFFRRKFLYVSYLRLMPVVGLEPTRLFKVPGF